MEAQLTHENLDVYQVAIQFVSLSVSRMRFPRGYSFLLDQLKKAASSIPLNIAEGCGKQTPTEQRRFFAIAKGSAHECGAILDVGLRLEVMDEEVFDEGKELLVRIVQMLSKM